jgi:hypothetical protein
MYCIIWIEDLEIIWKGGGRIQVAILHSLDQLGVILLHAVEPTPHHTQLYSIHKGVCIYVTGGDRVVWRAFK